VHADLSGTRHFLLVRWGLIPSWCKDPSQLPLMINARAESAADKPSFRGAMRHHRCLIPADGFYEWRRSGASKQPFFIRRRDGGPIAMAGLWDSWLGADGSEIDTGAILTTGANALMATIHDRMPVIVAPQDWQAWLDCAGTPPREVARLLRPADDDLLEAVPVSERVNAVRHDDAGLLAPLSEPLQVDAKPADGEPPRQGSLF